MSCIRDVSMINEGNPTVVVECILDNTKAEQELFLSYTKQKNQAVYPQIEAAVITLTDKTADCVIGTFEHVNGAKWMIPFVPESGHVYRVDVDIHAEEPVWAECEVVSPFVKHHHIETASYVAMVEYGIQNAWDSGGLQRETHYNPDTGLNPSDLPKRYLGTNGSCYSIDNPNMECFLLLSVEYFTSGPNGLEQQSSSSFDEIVTDLWPVENSNVSTDEYGTNMEFPVIGSYPDMIPYYAINYPTLVGRKAHRDRLVYDASCDLEDKYFLVAPVKDYVTSIFFKDFRLKCIYESKGLHTYLTDLEALASKEHLDDYSSIYSRDNLISNVHGGIGFLGSRFTEYLPWENKISPYIPATGEENMTVIWKNSI